MAPPIAIKVQVKGIEEIKQALGQLPDKIEKKVLRKSIRGGLKPMLARSRELAPPGLRRQVKLRAKKRSSKFVALNVQILTSAQVPKGEPWWGHLVEFGHDIVRGGPKSKGGRVIGHFPGRHFLERAFQQTADGSNKQIVRDTLEGIDHEIDALRKT